MRRRGFTLIELLVAVSIIALLIAILLPALGKARLSAQYVVCGSVQRQLGMAHQMYSINNRNVYIAVWISSAEYYLSNGQFRALMGMPPYIAPTPPVARGGDIGWKGRTCPTSPASHDPDGGEGGATTGPDKISRSFGYNRQGRGPESLAVSSVRTPASKLLMADATDWHIAVGGANYVTYWDVYGDTWPPYTLVAYRHDESINVVHYDGHVGLYHKTKSSGNLGLWDVLR